MITSWMARDRFVGQSASESDQPRPPFLPRFHEVVSPFIPSLGFFRHKKANRKSPFSRPFSLTRFLHRTLHSSKSPELFLGLSSQPDALPWMISHDERKIEIHLLLRRRRQRPSTSRPTNTSEYAALQRTRTPSPLHRGHMAMENGKDFANAKPKETTGITNCRPTTNEVSPRPREYPVGYETRTSQPRPGEFWSSSSPLLLFSSSFLYPSSRPICHSPRCLQCLPTLDSRCGKAIWKRTQRAATRTKKYQHLPLH